MAMKEKDVYAENCVAVGCERDEEKKIANNHSIIHSSSRSNGSKTEIGRKETKTSSF